MTLMALLAFPALTSLLARLDPRFDSALSLLDHSVHSSVWLFLAISLPLAALAITGVVLAFRGRLRPLFIGLLLVTVLNFSLYFMVLSPMAARMSGKQKKAFCLKVEQKIDSKEHLQFCSVESSLLFYLGMNIRPLKRTEVLGFFDVTDRPYLITTEVRYLAFKKMAPFEFVILEESGYLLREKTKYLLLGKKEG
jgi:hypothetical protein